MSRQLSPVARHKVAVGKLQVLIKPSTIANTNKSIKRFAGLRIKSLYEHGVLVTASARARNPTVDTDHADLMLAEFRESTNELMTIS